MLDDILVAIKSFLYWKGYDVLKEDHICKVCHFSSKTVVIEFILTDTYLDPIAICIPPSHCIDKNIQLNHIYYENPTFFEELIELIKQYDY